MRGTAQRLRARRDPVRNQALGTLERRWGNEGTHISVRLGPATHLELRALLCDFWDPFARLAHEDRGRERHATLPRRPEGRAGESVDGGLAVGVGKHRRVILGAEVGLHALSVRSAACKNVLSCCIPTHERNGFDGRIVADKVHRIVRPMDYIEHAWREPCFVCHVSE